MAHIVGPDQDLDCMLCTLRCAQQLSLHLGLQFEGNNSGTSSSILENQAT
jgi:hypothetical protein